VGRSLPPDPLDPTRRPNEPVTTVAPMPVMTPVDRLKRMYRITQNPDLLQLILLAENDG
jgi:hypothetical protein